LDCYERTIEIEPEYKWAWHNKGIVLENLARQASEKARHFESLAQQSHVKAEQLGYKG
jgi:hypothetical protein